MMASSSAPRRRHWSAMTYLIAVVLLCWSVGVVSGQPCEAITGGGYLTQNVVVNSWDTPCVIQKDLIIAKKYTLTLQPGVELRFLPGVMLAVNGTLIAKGTPTERILLTKNPDDTLPLNVSMQAPHWPEGIRLVDDYSVHLGRLQVRYRNKWRGICANNVNWTQTDTDVACQQLGFQTGNFTFIAFAMNNSQSYMLYYQPNCVGNESNILDCPGARNIQIGSGICRYQKTINLRCYGLSNSSVAKDFWWGLEFYNSTTYIAINNIISINETASILQNVDIMFAGVTKGLQAVPAVRASPSAPSLVNVTIQNCALDGTNFTYVMSSTIVYNSLFTNNRGHGLSVETILGHVEVRNSVMTGNHGNGIKAKFMDKAFFVIDEQMTFCTMANFHIQTFPQIITGIPFLIKNCGRYFESQYGQRITVNVIDMDIEPDANGTLEVFDGRDTTAPLLARWIVMNGTLPMGVTSTFYYMYIRFSWVLPPHVCPTLKDCVKFTIIVDSAIDAAAEFYMNSTEVSNNTQHGLYLENARNYMVINASTIVHNHYGAGVRVYGGAGDILINASTVSYNQDNGVNITYDGGWRIFNQSRFSHNYGHGINMTFNETSVDNKTRYTRHQKTEVSRSTFILNTGHGVFVGNYCSEGRAVVNDSRFLGNGMAAVEFQSCFKIVPNRNMTNMTIAYNVFDGNVQWGVKISPLINAYGFIANNTFTNHTRYTLLLDNTDDFLMNQLYEGMPVNYSVVANNFLYNQGVYVANLRLTQGSTRQTMEVMYNIFRGNTIVGASPTVNERTRAYAVVLLSSSNIHFMRNQLQNVDSKYEIATQLLDMSVSLQATMQWWGTTDYTQVIPKIFDQFNRYNLARILYHPALAFEWLWTPVLTDRNIAIEIDFQRGNLLGGRLTTTLNLPPGDYYVDRDLSIINYGFLYVSTGTTFQFENGLGMLVAGYVKFVGSAEDKIIMNLTSADTWINNTLVRLADGPTVFEGRLEVRASESDPWGTICSDSWTITDAAVVCEQMGLVVQHSGWKVLSGILPGSPDQVILRSNVLCTSLDFDILMCQADDQYDHSCNHTKDVYVKCVTPNWAGIRFLANAVPSVMQHVSVTGAGLLDPSVVSNVPAIQIDYNQHRLEDLIVANNLADGIQIMHNDVYANARLVNSVVRNNVGNGVTVRGSFFELKNCILANNGRAGFEYRPSYTTYEALQIRAGVTASLVWASNTSVYLGREDIRWVTTLQRHEPEVSVYELLVQVDPLYKVVVDVIDYNPITSVERVIVYDSRNTTIGPSTVHWKIEEDLPDFPVVSQLTYMTIRWKVSGVVTGRLAFVLRSKAWDWRWPFALLSLKNSTISGNSIGVMTSHYNQPSNEFLDLFLRFRWETIHYYGVQFIHNSYEAIHAQSITRWNLLYLPAVQVLQHTLMVAQITYNIESCYFAENGLGVDMRHLTVEFSNNVWIWLVSDNLFERNREGGFTIELPRVNLMYTELYNHSVDINHTVFQNNDNFIFRIDGFYCNSSITNNRFQGNRCKVGCITVSGTEKDFDVHDNEFTENTGTYIIEFNMNSHTPYTRWVDARFSYNIIKRNMKPPNTIVTATSKPTTYALGMRGVQNVTLNRNLFGNFLDFELLGGQSSSLLENYLDVTENYWGTIDQVEIGRLIFDFDDWNTFAIAEYFPFLINDNFNSRVFVGIKYRPILDLSKPLGGRITENLNLRNRGTPYIIKSDLTIMEHVSLIIDEGVELQFYPSVGILVLGSLVTNGSPSKRVKFGPILKSQYVTNGPPRNSSTLLQTRKKRDSSTYITHEVIHHPDLDPYLGYQLRLRGGKNLNPDEGFVEIYNNTLLQWSIVCDNSFNERTAEVACRTMGKESSNVIVTTNPYYDVYVLGYPFMHEQVIEWFWRDTLICDGLEATLNQCRYRINYNLYLNMENRQYVYVRCGARNLPREYDYWGNIRFSTPTYEFGSIMPGYSSLSYLDIYGGGVLHDDRVAAIQSIYRIPGSESVRIHNCDLHGYDYIAPMDQFFVLNNDIENNNGYAINVLVLNGASSEIPESQFVPLVDNGVPYNVYGMIRMCTVEKLVYVVDRVLLYYKYDFQTIDCIKVMRSKEPRKQIGVRFLQIQIYNDTMYDNTIEMFNGEYFDPRQLIGKLTVNSTLHETKMLYKTSIYYDTMGIRVTGSPAFGTYGFIIEVVTLPLSPIWRPDYGPGSMQLIANNRMTNNIGGGFVFQNVGEHNMRMTFSSNYIVNCGWKILNNTFPGVINVFIQNTRLMTIANNYIVRCAGGIHVNTTTKDNEVSLYSNITNNVIMHNTHGEPMHLEGHQFQGFDVRNNYIAFNDVDHRNIFAAFGVQVNFTSNVVYNNTGQCIINGSVLELISINQRYFQNAIYDNWASSYNRSTIFLKSAKFDFSYNFIVNPYNLYEMTTFNRTKTWDGIYPTVQAAYNWWGRGEVSYVGGRIWERRDDDNMIGVTYVPVLPDNTTVLQGKCYPGWRLGGTKCYWYFGGVAPYAVAERICRSNAARLAWARDPYGRETKLGELVSQFQFNYDVSWRVWIFADWHKDKLCPLLRDYKVEYLSCDTVLPFICEKDPFVIPHLNTLPIILAAAIAGGILLFVVCPLIVFALLKSSHRKEEKTERIETLQRSKRSTRPPTAAASHSPSLNRVLAAPLTATQFRASEEMKRRRPPLSTTDSDKKSFDVSGMTMHDTSTDSVFKAKIDFKDRRSATPSSLNGSAVKGKLDLNSSSYADSDLGPVNADNSFKFFPSPPKQLDNEISSVGVWHGNSSAPPQSTNDCYRNKSEIASPNDSFSGGAVGGVDPFWPPGGGVGHGSKARPNFDALGRASGSRDGLNRYGGHPTYTNPPDDDDDDGDSDDGTYANFSELNVHKRKNSGSRNSRPSELVGLRPNVSDVNNRSNGLNSSSVSSGLQPLKPPRPKPRETAM